MIRYIILMDVALNLARGRFRGSENGCYKTRGPLLEVSAFSDSIMNDKFEDVRTFVAVVQARGFAQAGKRLGIAKSAISRRVNDLEDRLGVRLLNSNNPPAQPYSGWR